MSGFHHPTVQFRAPSGGEPKEFLFGHGHAGQFVFQFLIIDQSVYRFSRIVVKSDYGRRRHVRERIDIILQVLAEDSAVRAFVGRELGSLPFRIDFPEGGA